MLLRKSIFAFAIIAFALSMHSPTVQSQAINKQQQARLADTAKTMHVLGTWQGIYVAEHRARPHQREVMLQFLGCCGE